MPHQLFRPRGFEARKVMPVHPARLRQTLRSAGNMARRHNTAFIDGKRCCEFPRRAAEIAKRTVLPEEGALVVISRGEG